MDILSLLKSYPAIALFVAIVLAVIGLKFAEEVVKWVLIGIAIIAALAAVFLYFYFGI